MKKYDVTVTVDGRTFKTVEGVEAATAGQAQTLALVACFRDGLELHGELVTYDVKEA